MTPPLRQRPERLEPERARPVCFCFHGLRPPPDTSPRRRVSAEPARRLASVATTTSWRKVTFGFTPKTFSSRFRVLTSLPWAFKTFVSMLFLLRLGGGLRGLRGERLVLLAGA